MGVPSVQTWMVLICCVTMIAISSGEPTGWWVAEGYGVETRITEATRYPSYALHWPGVHARWCIFRIRPHTGLLCRSTSIDVRVCQRRYDAQDGASTRKDDSLVQEGCSHTTMGASTERGSTCDVDVDVDDCDRDADTRGALSLTTPHGSYSREGRAHEGPVTERPILHTARLLQCLSRSLSRSRRCFCITYARKGGSRAEVRSLR